MLASFELLLKPGCIKEKKIHRPDSVHAVELQILVVFLFGVWVSYIQL